GYRLRNGARHRIDAGNRRRAERDAGEEDVEALQAAAHFAQGKAQGERNLAEDRAHPHAGTASASARRGAAPETISPERMATCRPQRAASAGSCVTSTSVMPRSACLEKRRSA